MQVIVAVPEALDTAAASAASLTREICGVGLLERTLLTAQRAGASEVVLVWPASMPIELAVRVLRSRRIQKKNNVRLLLVERFDPDQPVTWVALQPELQDRFVWLRT